MLPKWHILLGAIFSILIYFLFHITIFQAILIFLASFLIDFDHYLFSIKRTNSLNLKKAYYWHKSIPKNHKPIMHIFHTIEFMIVVAILSFFFNLFLYILIGMLFHSILDIISMIYNKNFNCREFSFIRYLLKDKNYYFNE